MRQTSSAGPLAWLYAALIVYASLYPFSGWGGGHGSPLDFVLEPSQRGITRFDLWSNFIAYLPFGGLVFAGAVRSLGQRTLPAALLASLTGAALSFAMEALQHYVPTRVPSAVDLATNSAGATMGAALGALVHASGGLGRWQVLRERWFIPRSGGGIVLLVMWPLALLFPTPMPLGLGQLLGELQSLLVDALDGSPAQDWAREWLERSRAYGSLARASELAAVACGLLAPCAVAFSIAVSPWRRLALLAGAGLLGIAATTLSTALNFSPQHGLAWLTPTAVGGLIAGACLAASMAWLPRRICAGLGLIAICALVAIVFQAPADPYYALSLQRWEQGRFIHFHGAARWVGWLWPYAAMIFLLGRVGARDDR